MWAMIFVVLAALALGACDSEPVSIPADPPDIIGAVATVDSAETVEGGRFLGSFRLTLVDGTTVDVSRGADYDGPRCAFVAERGDFGAVREEADCVVHIGLDNSEVKWVTGLRIESDGTVTPGFALGDLVEVNSAERFVVTQSGHTFPWRDGPPVVDCAHSDELEIDDPALIDHGAFHYRFDARGYLSELECGYEG